MNILIKNILTILPYETKICSIYITGDRITSITTAPDDFVPDSFIPDKTLNGTGKLLMPGFVNAHTHAAMTLLRNKADDLLFNEWLFNRIFPLEEQLTAEDCYWGMLLANMEMIRSGTTTFVDMYYFMDALSQAVIDSGIRAVLSRGLIGNTSDLSHIEQDLRKALDEIDRWKGYDNLTFMLSAHAPYTCDDVYQREIAQEARKRKLGINTHLSESLTEIETIREKYGCSPIELSEKTGFLSNSTIAAHCVHISDNDIKLLAKYNVNVATNPVSNLKVANGVAPVPKMLKAGINVTLGTDGAASNNSLNMFKDLGILTLIHKGINYDALAVSALEGFTIATKNGGTAIGRPDIGEIKEGNIADLVILDIDHPNMQPMNNPIAAIAYSTNGSEVETVLVGGCILMENREFKTIDSERVYFEVSKINKRIGD